MKLLGLTDALYLVITANNMLGVCWKKKISAHIFTGNQQAGLKTNQPQLPFILCIIHATTGAAGRGFTNVQNDLLLKAM